MYPHHRQTLNRPFAVAAALICFLGATGNLYAGGKLRILPLQNPPASSVPAVSILSESPNTSSMQQMDRAKQVMKAFAAAYPDRIIRVEFRNNDWAILLKKTQIPASSEGDWFCFAEGRLLPEALANKVADYDPQPFYNYPVELPPWRVASSEEAARYRNIAFNRNQRPPKRSQHFYDALWRAGSRDESYERIKSLRFLGHTVMVHYSILEELSLVEERILTEAKTDPQVQAWINSISTLDGWNWRSIADTQSRSFHAYGAAIDILPKSLGGKETYWLWTARKKTEWWTVSYSERFHPPRAVIQAFEANGFIWGGKWLFFDTMHFEYRPEILLFNGIPVNVPH